MFRSLVGVLITAVIGAVAVQPASAARIYGGQPKTGVPDEVVLALNDSGTAITKLTFHLDVSCGTDFETVDAGTTQSVGAVPDRLMAGAHYLVRGRVAAGKLSGTIVGTDRYDATTWELMNVVLSGTASKTRAGGTMAVKFVRTDETSGAVLAQCDQTIRWSALRHPGVVYAGATSQNEPIVLELTRDRRHVSHAHVAWYAPCRAGGDWVASHDEFDLQPFALSRTGAFARTYRYNLGQGSTEIERFAGRVGTAKAAGTFQSAVTLAGTAGDDSCSTGSVSWAVSTG